MGWGEMAQIMYMHVSKSKIQKENKEPTNDDNRNTGPKT
jgi:hypothetical protein